MMTADVAEAAADLMSDETVATVSTDTASVDEWQACAPAECALQTYDGADPLFVDAVIVDDSSLLGFEPVDVRVQYVSSETASGWAAYYYTVAADGVVQGVSVVASYDEPTIAAFVAEHADDSSVEISDYGDGWWIGGFPLELAPPVPDAVSWCGLGGDGVAYESTDVGGWDPSGSLNIPSDWSWDGSDAIYMWDENSESGGGWTWSSDEPVQTVFSDWSIRKVVGDFTCTMHPPFYARGAGESFEDAFAAYSATADADMAVNVLPGDVAVAEPVAVSPRAAAFADMGAMAAVATAMQAGSADAPPVGGRRRR